MTRQPGLLHFSIAKRYRGLPCWLCATYLYELDVTDTEIISRN
jgi:hypothetical protein